MKWTKTRIAVFNHIMFMTADGIPPNRAEIQRRTGIHRTTVKVCLEELEEEGFIYQAHKDGAWLPKKTRSGLHVELVLQIGGPREPVISREELLALREKHGATASYNENPPPYNEDTGT